MLNIRKYEGNNRTVLTNISRINAEMVRFLYFEMSKINYFGLEIDHRLNYRDRVT